jgi:hypothetical protein
MATRKKICPGPIVEPDLDLEVEDVRDSRGRQIDQAYVDKVIAGARKVGRPSLTAEGQRSPHVSFRVPTAIRAAAEAKAAAEGKTISQIVREALEHYVGSDSPTQAPSPAAGGQTPSAPGKAATRSEATAPSSKASAPSKTMSVGVAKVDFVPIRHGRTSMGDPRAFVSFDFDHNEKHKILFAGQACTDSPTPFAVQDWSSKSVLPQAEWERLIKQKIANTNMCIVLVGQSMATATGVAKEIAMAKEQNVPVFGVYVDGAGTSSTLPAGLARSRTIAWTWEDVAAKVRQMMGEGKNA